MVRYACTDPHESLPERWFEKPASAKRFGETCRNPDIRNVHRLVAVGGEQWEQGRTSSHEQVPKRSLRPVNPLLSRDPALACATRGLPLRPSRHHRRKERHSAASPVSCLTTRCIRHDSRTVCGRHHMQRPRHVCTWSMAIQGAQHAGLACGHGTVLRRGFFKGVSPQAVFLRRPQSSTTRGPTEASKQRSSTPPLSGNPRCFGVCGSHTENPENAHLMGMRLRMCTL